MPINFKRPQELPMFHVASNAALVATCLLAGLAVTRPALAQADVPVQAQADILEGEILRAPPRRALVLLTDYRALAATVPAHLLFVEAKAAASNGDPTRALQALVDYFNAGQPDDPDYRRALSLYPTVQAAAERARTARDEVHQRENQALLQRIAPEHRALLQSIVDAMVDIPAGRFRMGDLNGVGDPDEKPVRWVDVPAYRISRYQVTFEQFDQFTRATGRPPQSDSGWGRGRRPVINVGWLEAQAFVAWLTEVSGMRFRLPSEAEWEYAARAGTSSEYPWGSEADLGRANGKHDPGDPLAALDRSKQVGQYPANRWGLYDMVGNVWEWTEDCYAESFVGAPADGSAWVWEGCERRNMRGGSWNDVPGGLRVSNREVDFPTNRFNVLGMRLAQDR